MSADRLDYPVMITPLSADDGGGFAAYAPDLPGCMSDGETPEEALENVKDAIAQWVNEAKRQKRRIPQATIAIPA